MANKINIRVLIGSLVLPIFLWSCQCSEGVIHKVSGPTMGTSYSAQFVLKGSSSSKEDVHEKIKSILKNVNDLMSTYQTDSELSKLNLSSDLDWQPISPKTMNVLQIAQLISSKTDGFYDVTVGPAINLWGFGPRGEKKKPSDEKIREVLKKIGYKKLSLDLSRSKVKKGIPELYIDLSSIAKGFAVDEIARYLTSIEIGSYLVEVGGEIRVKGLKKGKSWKVAVEVPDRESRRVQRVLELSNMAMATSGDYRNFFKQGEDFYGHSFNPKTGRPIRHQLGSVSVFFPESCTRADAWATALMVLGPEKGLAVAEKEGLMAYFLYRQNGEVKSHGTSAFEKRFSVAN